MLIPAQTDLVMIGLAAIGLFGTIAYLVRGGRLFWVVVAGGIYTVLATVAAIVTIACSSYVVHVTGGRTPEAARQDLLFGTTLDLNGHEVHVSASDGRSIIINDTDHTLRLHAEVYSQFAYGASRPPPDRTIAPYSAIAIPDFVDNLGPGDPPPREVSASSSSSEVTKYWLTW